MSLNVSIIMGRLVADPKMEVTNGGVEMCRFTVAADRRYTKQGEERQADFIDCIAWRQSAVFVDKYFHKGAMIAVTGSIQTRTYEDKEGKKRKAVEVVVDNVSFCGSKSDNAVPTVASAVMSNTDVEINDDDLPF